MPAPPLTRLQRGARRFRRAAYLAASLAILCVVAQLLFALSPLWRGGDRTTALWNGLGQADLSVPVLCFVWGLLRARRLFQRVEAGEVFGPENSRDFARIGWAVAGGAIWSLTLGGMALIAIGQVVAEARRLKVDNDSFL